MTAKTLIAAVLAYEKAFPGAAFRKSAEGAAVVKAIVAWNRRPRSDNEKEPPNLQNDRFV